MRTICYVFIKALSLVMAILSILVYAEMTFPYRLFLWVPINVGYAIFYSIDYWGKEK